jgi:hypothetical protein
MDSNGCFDFSNLKDLIFAAAARCLASMTECCEARREDIDWTFGSVRSGTGSLEQHVQGFQSMPFWQRVAKKRVFASVELA